MSTLCTHVNAALIAFAAAICISAATWYAFELRGNKAKSLVVRAVAHEWWWEFDYPTLGINDTDELHVPSGTNIHLQLVSADVIHSLWIPGLSKAIPIIPGASGALDFLVKSPGRFYGNCDAGCGCNTVCMRFPVIADSSANFENWIKRRRSGASHSQHVSAAPACVLNPSTMPAYSSARVSSLNSNVYAAHTHRGANLSAYKPQRTMQ